MSRLLASFWRCVGEYRAQTLAVILLSSAGPGPGNIGIVTVIVEGTWINVQSPYSACRTGNRTAQPDRSWIGLVPAMPEDRDREVAHRNGWLGGDQAEPGGKGRTHGEPDRRARD